jgi:hypothetical protein
MVKTCNKCVWSIDESRELRCVNDEVVGTNTKALSSINPSVKCSEEREKLFLGACGKSGKLWAEKGV